MIECQWSHQKNICKSNMGQDQVSGGVSVLCWHAAPLQMIYRNLSQLGKKSNSVIWSRSVMRSKIVVMPDQWRVLL